MSRPSQTSRQPDGLVARLDRLLYRRDESTAGRPHLFVYFITIENESDAGVRFLGRKWVLRRDDGETEVIEAEKIVGRTPYLAPGDAFSYNSFHMPTVDTEATATFYGLDDAGRPVHVRMPPFRMELPKEPL